MNFRTLLKSVLMTAVLLGLMSIASFAQVYVSATDGDNLNGNGSISLPYKTIQFAVDKVVANGGVVYVKADTYNENNQAVRINTTKTVSLVAVTYNSLNTVNIKNGIRVNSTGVVNIGLASDNSKLFLLGATNPDTALVLTKGAVNISTANVKIFNNGTITRIDGSLSEVPTVTNVNVAYLGTETITAGGEMPASLGKGVITVNNLATGKTIAVNKDVAWTITAYNSYLITNKSAGTLAFNGAVAFNKGTDTASAIIVNKAGGALTFANGITVATDVTVSAVNAAAGTLAFNGSAKLQTLTNATGKVVLTGGSVAGSVQNNGAVGVIELKAGTEFKADVKNNGSIVLNSNTLTLSGTALVTNNGKIYSVESTKIGSGVLAVTGTITVNGGEVPNMTVAAGKSLTVSGVTAYGYLTSAGAVALAGNLTLKGAYTQNVGGTLDFGANTFEVAGDWARYSNVPTDVTFGTGTLKLTGAAAQLFNPGASLTLYSVVIDKDDVANVVTMGQSVVITNSFNIIKGSLDLFTYYIRMQGGTFTNNSKYFTSATSEKGYVIFENGLAGVITGSGIFSNLDIRGGSIITAGSAIKFSGDLQLRSGTLSLGLNTFQYTSDIVAVPSVTRYDLATMTAVDQAQISVKTGVVYDLTYAGAAPITAAQEWIAAGIRNLTINTTVNTSGVNFSIAGKLSVAKDKTLNLVGSTLTLPTDGIIHDVIGSVTPGKITATGNGIQVNGSSNQSFVDGLAFEPSENNYSFSSKDLKNINTLTVQGVSTKTGATAAVSMNSVAATVGTVTNKLATLTLNMNSEASLQTGNLVVTSGTVNYTRGADKANQTINGVVTIDKGTLSLGSDVYVLGVSTLNDGTLKLNSYNYTAVNDFTRNATAGTKGLVTGSGKLVFDASVAAKTITVGTAFSVPNVEFIGLNANTIVAAVPADLPWTVTGSLLHTSGQLDLNTLNFAGTNYTYVKGPILGTLVMTGTSNVYAYKIMNIPNLILDTDGSVTLNSDDPAVARIFKVSNVFTQKKGTLNLLYNNFVLTNVVTPAYVRTEGAILATTGYFVFNGAGNMSFTPGVGLEFPNLAVSTGDGFTVSSTAVKEIVTVGKNLWLEKGVLTVGEDADNKLRLHIADNATIRRSSDLSFLTYAPLFGTGISMIYDVTPNVTAKELPATVKDFTASVPVTFAAPVTVTGTANISSTMTTSATKNMIFADGSTLNLLGGAAFTYPIAQVANGHMTLIYDGVQPNAKNWPAGLVLTAVDIKQTIILHDNRTVQGDVNFVGGSMNLAGYTLTSEGNISDVSSNFFYNGTLSLAGANNTTFTVKGNTDASPDLTIKLNKAASANTVTLVGGNLTLSTILNLTNGLFVTTDETVLILTQRSLNGQPVQGYDRSGIAAGNYSHVVGNVQKFLNPGGINFSNRVALSRVIYPVGTLKGDYRPMSFWFKNAPQSALNLLVNAKDVAPTGTNGMPIHLPNNDITNYPNLHWLVKSDVSLNPSYKFDMDAEADGYTDYNQKDVQKLRLIRRDLGGVDNNWYLQGEELNYANQTVSEKYPYLKVIDAVNGISAYGEYFTISQSNKPPVITVVPASGSVTVNEGQTVSAVFTAVDPDINQTATLSVSTDPAKTTVPAAAAKFDAATGKFTWVTNSTSAGDYKLTVVATDNNVNPAPAAQELVLTIKVINVNAAPVFVPANILATSTVLTGKPFEHTYGATDADGETLAYSLTVAPVPTGVGPVVNPATGVVSWTPTWAQKSATPYVITVKVTDGIETVSTTTALTVKAGRLKGDVNNDGVVAASDASPVLKMVVGSANVPADPTSEDFYAADAKADGMIGAMDAYYILYYVNNDIYPDATLAKEVVKGNVAFGTINSKDNTVTVPVNLTEAQNVHSITMSFNVDKNAVDFQKVSANLPEGWSMVHNYADGKLTIAMTGLAAINAGTVASIDLGLKSKEAKSEIAGTISINDEYTKSLDKVGIKQIPAQFELSQNYPNPFNPTTTVKYSLAADSKVTLNIFNMLGQKIKTLYDGMQESGFYSSVWDGTNDLGQKVTSGIYIYRLETGSFVSIKKMNLLK